jgi:hypothetical protein
MLPTGLMPGSGRVRSWERGPRVTVAPARARSSKRSARRKRAPTAVRGPARPCYTSACPTGPAGGARWPGEAGIGMVPCMSGFRGTEAVLPHDGC